MSPIGNVPQIEADRFADEHVERHLAMLGAPPLGVTERVASLRGRR